MPAHAMRSWWCSLRLADGGAALGRPYVCACVVFGRSGGVLLMLL